MSHRIYFDAFIFLENVHYESLVLFEASGFCYIKVRTQGSKLVHPNIYPICELLEFVKSLVLQGLVCRVPTTQGDNSVSERSPGENPALIMHV